MKQINFLNSLHRARLAAKRNGHWMHSKPAPWSLEKDVTGVNSGVKASIEDTVGVGTL